jgi:polyvinyl alcohol dehydrogenase (cytochrome)
MLRLQANIDNENQGKRLRRAVVTATRGVRGCMASYARWGGVGFRNPDYPTVCGKIVALGRTLLLWSVLGGAATAGAVPDSSASSVSMTVSAAGETIYRTHCSACHDHPETQAPPVALFRYLRTPEDVVRVLNLGVMRQQGSALSADEKRTVAIFLTQHAFSSAVEPDAAANRCSVQTSAAKLRKSDWNGWGRDLENTGFQPHPGLKPVDVSKLRPKWVFAYPGGSNGQPAVVGERIYVATNTGRLYALDIATGCTYWSADFAAPAHSGVTVAAVPAETGQKLVVFFADESASVHALDAQTGQSIWATKIEDHPLARITGGVKFYQGRLYVPVSSQEELGGADAKYPCCTFRGAIAALDALTGKIVWKARTIQEVPRPFKINSAGTQMLGPAGAAVWNTPTIDAKRSLIYATTGNSYTTVPADATDAVVAFDLVTGERKWVSQVQSDDNWQGGCTGVETGNCPNPLGPDFDFRTPPVLQTLSNGRQIIVAGSKSGVLYGFDPDHAGRILWKTKLGEGALKNGIFGPAVDGSYIYVSANLDGGGRGENRPGATFAIDGFTGRTVWRTVNSRVSCGWGEDGCLHTQKSPLAAMPGFVFAGSADGHIDAYRMDNGKVVWDFDTAYAWRGINGANAEGGAIGYGGQAVAHGMLFVNSGSSYGRLGNALIAFSVDGR